jgi:hypothetical protein
MNWINVEDELPKMNDELKEWLGCSGPVLVLFKANSLYGDELVIPVMMGIGAIFEHKNLENGDKKLIWMFQDENGSLKFANNEVTHWMPLPDQPAS